MGIIRSTLSAIIPDAAVSALEELDNSVQSWSTARSKTRAIREQALEAEYIVSAKEELKEVLKRARKAQYNQAELNALLNFDGDEVTQSLE